MKTLSINQTQAWCIEHGLRLDDSGNPHFPGEGVRRLELQVPTKPGAFAPLILALLDATVDGMDQPSGAEHLLWFRDWSMWSDLWTSVGVELSNHLRLGFGLSESMDDAPAILFAESEIGSLISFSLIPLVFGWDCYVIPASGKHFAFISHDEWIGVSSTDEATEAEILSRIGKWGPKASPFR
jgi:hypothetical protein